MSKITGSDSSRLIRLAAERERQREDLEAQKKKIKEASESVKGFNNKFATHYDAIETTLKSSTVGLVTLDEMKAKQQDYIKQREKQLAHKSVKETLVVTETDKQKKDRLDDELRKRMLSFDPEDDYDADSDESKGGDEDVKPATENIIRTNETDDYNIDESKPTMSSTVSGVPIKKKKLGKDPTVDTSFLPDKDREEEDNRLREVLSAEWAARQEEIKKEYIHVAFSYWDGSGHRNSVTMQKGNTIGEFMQKALEQLRKQFTDLKVASADNLMYIKCDVIIPHFYTFHDIIVTKAMGKTGPLFYFDSNTGLNIIEPRAGTLNEDGIEAGTQQHPGKICLRSWFERNKHIYPASRWEPFFPKTEYDPNYRREVAHGNQTSEDNSCDEVSGPD